MSYTRRRLSPRTVGLVACLAAPLMMPREASAQFWSAVDLSSRSARSGTGDWESQFALSPSARFDHPRVSIDGRLTALGNGQRLDGFGSLAATYFSPTWSGFQLSVAGFADRSLLNETFSVSKLGADARLSYRRGTTGAWLGRELSRDNRSTPLSAVPRVSAGTWRQFGNTMLTASLSSFGSREGARGVTSRTEYRQYTKPAGAPDTGTFARTIDTITVTDSGNTGTPRGWNNAEVSFDWGVGRLAFRGVIGTRLFTNNLPNETWGQVQGSLALVPDVALIAASGVHPASASYGIARARFVELGFRVAPRALMKPRLPASVRPVAAAFEIADGERGQRTLSVRVPNARTVELSGDFTNWEPIALARATNDRWEATLLIPPGLHRVAIRADGDTWAPPPGVSSVTDEFQGTVGVIVVK